MKFEAYWFANVIYPEGWQRVSLWKWLNILVRGRGKLRITVGDKNGPS